MEQVDIQYKNNDKTWSYIDKQAILIFKYSILINIAVLVYTIVIFLTLIIESGNLVSTTDTILNSMEIILPDLVKQSKHMILDIANMVDLGLTIYSIGNIILDFIICICYNFITYIILSISTLIICHKNTRIRQITYRILNSIAMIILLILMIIYFPTKFIGWLDNIKALLSILKIMKLTDIQNSIFKIIVGVVMPIFQFIVYSVQAIMIFRYTFTIKRRNN